MVRILGIGAVVACLVVAGAGCGSSKGGDDAGGGTGGSSGATGGGEGTGGSTGTGGSVATGGGTGGSAESADAGPDGGSDAGGIDWDAGATASEQIAAVRRFFLGSGAPPTSIVGAWVTALKPAVPDAGAADPIGFFVQASSAGPAIFVSLDPSTAAAGAALAVGDEVTVRVTAASFVLGDPAHPFAVTAATVTRTGTGHDVTGLAQNAAGLSFTTAGYPQAYESQLFAVKGRLTNPPADGGPGFLCAGVANLGNPDGGSFVLRVPAGLARSEDLGAGCDVDLPKAPLWRYDQEAQALAFTSAQLGTVSCPAPAVVSAKPSDNTTVKVQFSRAVASATVVDTEFSVADQTGFPLTASGATLSAEREVTLTTDPQTAGTIYRVTVGTGVTDTRGTAMGTSNNTGTFTGVGATTTCTPAIVISAVSPGVAFDQTFVELHNRSSAVAGLAGLSLQFKGATGTWKSQALSGSIPAGGYYLIGEAPVAGGTSPLPATDATLAFPLTGSKGTVALVSGTATLTSCPTTFEDLVGWGATTCSSGNPTTSASAAGWATRGGGGCANAGDNLGDFGAGGAAPNNAQSTALTCTCP